MKELYTKPMAEIEEFPVVDVMTVSTEADKSENNNGDWV